MIIELTADTIRLDGKELSENYIVSYYNGVSDISNGPCITFSELIKRHNLEEIQEIVLDRGLYTTEILKQILSTRNKIDNIKVKKWNLVSENDRALLANMMADKGYLFETNASEFNAILDQYNPEPVNITNVLVTSEKTCSLGNQDKFISDNIEIDDLFDKAVRYIGNHTREKAFIINVGSMDGKTHDELAGYTVLFDFKGLYVEPIPYIFESLKSNFSDDNLFENSAITNYDGQIEMLTIPQEVVDNGLVHDCFRGMSSIYPPKNGLGSVGDKETVEKYSKKISVPCLTFDSLLRKHNISNFDILKIDAEGHDWEIFKEVNLDTFHPSVIRMEWFNLSKEDKQNVLDKFTKYNYVYEMMYGDITAISNDIYLKLIGKSPEKKDTINAEQSLVVPIVSSVSVVDKKRYKIECEITAIGDIFSLLYNTFSEVNNLKVTPIFDAVPIKIMNGECRTPDYTLFVYPDGISLVFDPISRESGNKYVLQKQTDHDIINWLETMDSEQVYKMAQLTFTKMQ